MSNLPVPAGPHFSARHRFVPLLLSVVILVGVMGSRAEAAGLGCDVDPSWATMKNAWATEVIILTNAHRASLGLPALTPSVSLTDAAEWKAAHMANHGYMAHDDPAPPVDRSWDQRIEDCGYTYGMGENIAFGYKSPEAVVAGWIGSTGHRHNIEDPDYRVIGVGAALDEEGTPYWAQTFGTHLEAPVRDAARTEDPPAVGVYEEDVTQSLEADRVSLEDRSENAGPQQHRMRPWAWGYCLRLSVCLR